MKKLRPLLFVLALVLGRLAAADGGFLSTLSTEERVKLGLEQLTPQQAADLNAAVEGYRNAKQTVVVEQAVQQAVEEAKVAAVEEYRKKEEPSVVQRALEVLRRKHDEEKEERITAKIVGKFDGWEGDKLFRLDNGQVWRQATADTYITRPAEDVAVVIYKSSSGYWRLRILDDKGAWVTVKRVQ